MELQSIQHKESSQGKVSPFRKHSNVQLPNILKSSKTPLGNKSQKEEGIPNAEKEQPAPTPSKLGIAALASGSWNIMSTVPPFRRTDTQQ